MMKHTFLLLCAVSLLALGTFSCNRRSKSELLYRRAESAFQAKEYQRAQRIIDSIPTGGFYSSEWSHKGIILNQRITLEENRRNLAYIDSLLPPLYKIRKALLPMFRYVQDSLYQDEGYYL
ncbi:MAG: hypothetical protein LUI04_06935, partial [Porphyromonadaceae bacterium]|nr:hypothetical protein [Porphyromonadaceae bacterium]